MFAGTSISRCISRGLSDNVTKVPRNPLAIRPQGLVGLVKNVVYFMRDPRDRYGLHRTSLSSFMGLIHVFPCGSRLHLGGDGSRVSGEHLASGQLACFFGQ